MSKARERGTILPHARAEGRKRVHSKRERLETRELARMSTERCAGVPGRQRMQICRELGKFRSKRTNETRDLERGRKPPMDAYIANINGGRFGARVSGFDEALWKVCPAARKADGDRYG